MATNGHVCMASAGQFGQMMCFAVSKISARNSDFFNTDIILYLKQCKKEIKSSYVKVHLLHISRTDDLDNIKIYERSQRYLTRQQCPILYYRKWNLETLCVKWVFFVMKTSLQNIHWTRQFRVSNEIYETCLLETKVWLNKTARFVQQTFLLTMIKFRNSLTWKSRSLECPTACGENSCGSHLTVAVHVTNVYVLLSGVIYTMS